MVGKNNVEIISVEIEAELESLEQIKKLFDGTDNGCSVQLCDGRAELTLMSTGNSLAFDGGSIAEFILTFSIGVATGVVANALYAAICADIKKIEIHGRRTRITEESIAQTLETIKNMILLLDDKNGKNLAKKKNKGGKKKKK
jgi:hypothetical protein